VGCSVRSHGVLAEVLLGARGQTFRDRVVVCNGKVPRCLLFNCYPWTSVMRRNIRQWIGLPSGDRSTRDRLPGLMHPHRVRMSDRELHNRLTMQQVTGLEALQGFLASSTTPDHGPLQRFFKMKAPSTGPCHLGLRDSVVSLTQGTRHSTSFVKLEAHFERRLNPSGALSETHKRILISPTDTREGDLVPIQ
jgi:hypothetical protein